MTKTLHVKPAPRTRDGEEGVRIVRDPNTREPLPAKGAKVPLTTYWRKRLLDGDVVEVGAKKTASGGGD